MMNKLKGGCFIGHDTSILLYKYSCIYNIPSCSGKLVLDSSRLREGIFVDIFVKFNYPVLTCINAIKMELSILYFKRLLVNISLK